MLQVRHKIASLVIAFLLVFGGMSYAQNEVEAAGCSGYISSAYKSGGYVYASAYAYCSGSTGGGYARLCIQSTCTATSYFSTGRSFTISRYVGYPSPISYSGVYFFVNGGMVDSANVRTG